MKALSSALPKEKRSPEVEQRARKGKNLKKGIRAKGEKDERVKMEM